MVLRPDEEASRDYLERDVKFRNKVKGGLTSAATLGSGAAGLGAKVLPFLNEYIPFDLAMKGINKVAPEIGKFLRNGQSMGLDLKQGFDFVKQKLNQEEESKPAISDDENIIMKFSPKLSSLVDKLIEAGHPIEEIEQIARSPGQKSVKDVEHMEKSLGMTFYDILRSIYGGAKRSSKQPIESVQSNPMQEQLSTSQDSQQPGQGQAALMAILQKLQQSRKM